MGEATMSETALAMVTGGTTDYEMNPPGNLDHFSSMPGPDLFIGIIDLPYRFST